MNFNLDSNQPKIFDMETLKELYQTHSKTTNAKELNTDIQNTETGNTLRYSFRLPSSLTPVLIKAIYTSFNEDNLIFLIRLGIIPKYPELIEPVQQLMYLFTLSLNTSMNTSDRYYIQTPSISMKDYTDHATKNRNTKTLTPTMQKIGISQNKALCEIAYKLLSGTSRIEYPYDFLESTQSAIKDLFTHLGSDADIPHIKDLLNQYENYKECYETNLEKIKMSTLPLLNKTQQHLLFLQEELESLKTNFETQITKLVTTYNKKYDMPKVIDELEELLTYFRTETNNLTYKMEDDNLSTTIKDLVLILDKFKELKDSQNENLDQITSILNSTKKSALSNYTRDLTNSKQVFDSILTGIEKLLEENLELKRYKTKAETQFSSLADVISDEDELF